MSSANWPTSIGTTKLNQIITIATTRLANGGSSTWQDVLDKANACIENEGHTVKHETGSDAQLEVSVTTAQAFAAGGRAGQCSGELEHPGVGVPPEDPDDTDTKNRKGGKTIKGKPFKKKPKRIVKKIVKKPLKKNPWKKPK